MLNKIKNILIVFLSITGFVLGCTNCDIPVANAGQDKTYYIGSTLTFDGSSSYDPEGSTLTYSWTSEYFSPDFETDFVNECQLQGGPSSLVESFCTSIYFNDNFDANCEDNGLVPTVLDLCEQSEYSNWFNCDDLVDNVCEEVPSTCEIPSYTCSLTAQQVPVNDCSEFYNLITENYKLRGSNPEFELGATADTFTVSLVVNDCEYDSDVDQVLITITDVNTPPVIDVITSFEVNKNSEFTIDASGTYDATLHTNELEYSWSYPSFVLVEGLNDNSSIISLISPVVTEDQEFTIVLTVDDGVDVSQESISVNVIANIRPYAIPGENFTIGQGAVFTLDGTSSYDVDGTINTYLWTFPNGIEESNIVSGSINDATLDVLAPAGSNVNGDYVFYLTVTDNSSDDSNPYTGEKLFITEYIEPPSGTNSNCKYIELYNPSESSISLDDYEIWYISGSGNWAEKKLLFNTQCLDSNGQEIVDDEDCLDGLEMGDDALNSSTLDCSDQSGSTCNIDSIDSGETLVIIKSESCFSNEDDIDINSVNYIEWGALNPSGDDAIGLYLEGQGIIDSIGDDSNPGSIGWVVSDVSSATKNAQLIRKEQFNGPNSSWEDSAVNEWLVYEDVDLTRAGNHYCSTCDNQVTVTVTDNVQPVSQITGAGFSVVVGSQISLDGSTSSDPEGESLTYSWTSDYSGLQITDSDTFSPSFIVPNDSDGLQITFTLEVSDGVLTDTDTIILTIETENSAPIIVVEVEKMNYDDDDIAYSGEIYEEYEIFLKASDSDDSSSSTGILTFSWTAPAVDYNNDGVNDIVFSDATIANPTFEIGKYFGVNRSYDLTLEVSDGDLTSSETVTVNMIARMPIINVGTPVLTGYEGEYIRMEALSTEDPNGSISNLEFDWSGNNSEIFGVCTSSDEIIDNNGNLLGSQNYDATDWCNSTSDCNGNGTCSREKAVAFRLLPTSIGVNTDYTINVEVEDDDDYESETSNVVITSVARYPVANAGYDKTFVMGQEMRLNGQMSHDPQEEVVFYSYYDNDNQWEEGEESVGLIAFYEDSYVCESDMVTSCVDENDCADSDCIVKVTPKDGYTFTWVMSAGGPNDLPEDLYNLIKNEVNPCLTCIAPYDEYQEFYPDDIFDECSVNFSGEYDPNTYTSEYDLVITDNTGCSVNCDNNSGPDDTGSALNSSNSSSVTLTLSQNCPPNADAGKNIIYNRGEPQEIEVYTSDFRALTGSEYMLDGSKSSDSTPIDDLSYLWNVRGYCPENYSQADFAECTASNVVLSNVTDVKPTFTVPTDLCIDNISTDEKSCCENNGGNWLNIGECDDSQLWNKDGKTLTITLEVSDGFLTSEEDTITVTYNSYSWPAQPLLYATGTHYEGDDNGSVNLFWNNVAEGAIDDLTRYADFQGYKIYRSEDYGMTWGSPSTIVDGEILGWEPYEQFDMSAEQDSTYCLFKNDNKDCGYDSEGNEVSTTQLNRYNQVSGIVDWVEGFAWQNLGSNTGLSQTLIDTDVIDGVDYTYTVTSYDRGVKPDTLIYGHYGKLESNGTWNDDIWVPGSPLYTYQDTMVADTFFLYQLEHKILKSIIIGPDTDLDPNDDNLDPNVKVNNNTITANTHFFILDFPDEWNVGDENESVSLDDIDEGISMGWKTNRGAPLTNPFGYPAKESLESLLGASETDQNFVTVSSDYYATNITFPSEEDIDQFISADCKAIGNGDKWYEIVNEDELDTSLVRFEIQADSGVDIFEGHNLENACLYAYIVKEVTYDNAPTEYLPLELDGESLTHPLSGCDSNIDSCSDCYLDEEGDLSGLLELPGVSVDCSNPNSKTITIPNYLVECHELDFIDDPNYQGNWTPFFNGIRMRFDNALRNEPDNFEVAIDSIYSTPNEEFGYFLTLENEYYGYLRLLYENNFNNKPAYAYEIEFSHSYVDTAFENTTDQFGGSLAECGRSFSTLLPFKIKNLNTGKYVKIKHSDEGIWNGISTNVPGWFDDTQEHPGTGDCVWSPGEFLTFERDSVIVGDADEYEPVKTFKLELSYNMNSILDAHPEYCDYILTYDQALTYPPGVCVYAEGVIWKADTQVNPQDGYLPNGWYDENGTNINDNPWFPLYPWDDGDKIIVKPKTWYVDGDYWIANMSVLGQTDEVVQTDLDEITVVPNPYIVDSKYNEAVIKFYHLPDQCTISIYTITGELVTILNHGPGSIKSSLSWNLKNAHGKDVAPGLYIYKVETESGLTKVNKFAIVR